MFEIPPTEVGEQGTSDNNAIFLEQITAQELANFFSYIYMK